MVYNIRYIQCIWVYFCFLPSYYIVYFYYYYYYLLQYYCPFAVMKKCSLLQNRYRKFWFWFYIECIKMSTLNRLLWEFKGCWNGFKSTLPSGDSCWCSVEKFSLSCDIKEERLLIKHDVIFVLPSRKCVAGAKMDLCSSWWLKKLMSVNEINGSVKHRQAWDIIPEVNGGSVQETSLSAGLS